MKYGKEYTCICELIFGHKCFRNSNLECIIQKLNMFGGMLVAYLESLFDIPFSLSLIFEILS
jgi:hypothetical protein